jgi:hypothetical protein
MSEGVTTEVVLPRDHLFISYAWEDGALAEWLARKLTAHGYRVWIDRFKLLAGEPWPSDIDRAIKTRTFRMIALLSQYSLAKENPRKERQMALTLSKERREPGFLIPLNVEGLKPSEIGWELQDLNYVPFERWSTGFRQLLESLEKMGAPKADAAAGAKVAVATFLPPEVTSDTPESVYANALVVEQVPDLVQRYTMSRPLAKIERVQLLERWAFESVDETRVLAFTPPPDDAIAVGTITRGHDVSWRHVPRIDGKSARNVISALIKKSMVVRCIERGLIATPSGNALYFPAGLLPKDRIGYSSYSGKPTRVGVLGERKFAGQRSRYHLALAFWVRTDLTAEFVVETKIRLHMTDPTGLELDAKMANARRKKVTKSWWNHEWLCRQIAVASYLAGSDDPDGRIVIGSTTSTQLIIAGQLLSATVGTSIHDDVVEQYAPTIEEVLQAGAGEDETSTDADQVPQETSS